MITPSQSKANFTNAMRGVEESKSLKELGRISYQLYQILQDEMNKKFYFPEGGTDKFWTAYKKKKEYLALREAAHAGEQKEMDLTSTDSKVA